MVLLFLFPVCHTSQTWSLSYNIYFLLFNVNPDCLRYNLGKSSKSSGENPPDTSSNKGSAATLRIREMWLWFSEKRNIFFYSFWFSAPFMGNLILTSTPEIWLPWQPKMYESTVLGIIEYHPKKHKNAL